MGAQDRPQCHFDIEINREPVGRIMFQLFSDICPKTCKNFLCLCSGEKGLGKTTGKKLCYKGSTFHRVVKNFMIQGGDFSEGNGKGGESIYGGYFKDENFILKHDRAFLLSMANRGKHTNGSQFFITTKPAPHLDGVHVVFGLVISGFEVIEQIENLKTDAASRPYADVRVIDCGVLATKSAKEVFEKKRKKPTHSEVSDSSSNSSSSSDSSSESETEQERSRRRKHKRRPKVKRSKKRRKEASSSEEPRNKHIIMSPKGHSERSDTNEKRSVDSNAKREKPVVRPEEIPPVPENRFLLRRDMPLVTVEPEPKIPDVTPIVSDQKPSVSKSGRKIKGRGTIRYHTPPRSRSCSESDDDDSSETPPHWKEEMQRLRAYRPPSGEKWSKGDKLSDPCSSRWDERSLSQRSRSWSYNGYYSDLSTARHSDGHHKKRRKEKKVKHKKKAKKQKHCRRHKQTKKRRLTVPSDIESSKSSTRRVKSSCGRERRSRSSSLSSHHSSKRDWSKSDKDDQSSSTHSSRDSYRSKSHSQSYSRGSSRSRTPSKSSSHSRSRSKSRSSSKSGRQRTASKSPRRTASQLSENKPVKSEPLRATVTQNESVVVQPVVAENIPVIPLSDSPPPSRWKPGQKPWKPSYERIQEMKAKTTHLLPIQSTYSLANIKETGSSSSYHKREKNSESDRSAYSKYSDRSSESSPRSRSRSSRSRSYSRSYTRSRSLASSHSRSRSPSSRSHSRNKYSDRSRCSRSSSYSSVSSDNGRRAKRKFRPNGKKNNTSNKRHSSSSEKTLRNKYVKVRDRSSYQRKYSESRSSLDYSSDSEESSVQVTQSAQEKEKQVQMEMNNKQEKNRDEEKSKPERECPSSKKRTLKENLADHFRNGSKTKRKNYAGSKWDSESNSERDITKNSKNNARPSSDKEEGEATSDSESELGEIHIKAKPTTKSSANTSLPDSNGAWKSSRQRSSTSDSEGFCSNSESTRGKPHKHKHGSKETLKREHTKKAKEKLKGKKDKKHKAPKRKQAFHWQPPLEFGEEEEEEINEKQVTQEAKEKKQVSENSEAIKENILQTEKSCEDGSLSGKHNTVTVPPDIDQPTKEGSKLSNSPTALNAEENVVHSPLNIECVEESVPSGVEDVLQTDDNMEICTPDRSSPAKVEETSPPGNSRLDTPDRSIVLKQDMPTEHPEAEVGKQESSTSESKTVGKVGKQDGSSASSAFLAESTVKREVAEKSQTSLMDNKWKPLQGVGNLAAPTATTSSAAEVKALTAVPEMKPQGLRIEIKSKNKVRPGSLFDEVRKTARLNRRPRNQESSSDEQTPSRDGDSQSRSPSRSRSKSETKSRHRTRSVSYSHSRSRSRSSTSSYRSRSYSRSRSRGWYSRGRTRSRSSSYRSYKSHRTSSRSRSRSSSYDPHSRSSRSYTYDSYSSRSRSRSRSQRSDSYHRGRSYNRRSRSCRSYGSDSESDRSYSHHRSPSESSRYS
ncbi:NK-tumor recognition protein isoform X1 [Camelus ferus]|uniref:peptidylprolyl isomerase n=6 Tax=Camelus TaxID=9836 RepID=A0A8B7K9T9_CAMFR|nr:NK-tumor recognition protein isoform X1 [Camelus ferus]XP_014411885.2 NK-tumor recognition protein isoform X1 [Camelus ferus]XP_045365747.1 NK-tumor recognition protein isoform X1 [Camelus bactrianus]XP_045365748.1 NK-tumor recognition protein isoform X1 [Camelus bactrianus]